MIIIALSDTLYKIPIALISFYLPLMSYVCFLNSICRHSAAGFIFSVIESRNLSSAHTHRQASFFSMIFERIFLVYSSPSMIFILNQSLVESRNLYPVRPCSSRPSFCPDCQVSFSSIIRAIRRGVKPVHPPPLPPPLGQTGKTLLLECPPEMQQTNK